MIDLVVHSSAQGTVLSCELEGEARLEVVGELERAVRAGFAQGARDVLINLELLTFMDSASAGTLLRLQQEARIAGGRLVLHSLPRVISRLVERTGLNQALTIAADEPAARALL